MCVCTGVSVCGGTSAKWVALTQSLILTQFVFGHLFLFLLRVCDLTKPVETTRAGRGAGQFAVW